MDIKTLTIFNILPHRLYGDDVFSLHPLHVDPGPFYAPGPYLCPGPFYRLYPCPFCHDPCPFYHGLGPSYLDPGPFHPGLCVGVLSLHRHVDVFAPYPTEIYCGFTLHTVHKLPYSLSLVDCTMKEKILGASYKTVPVKKQRDSFYNRHKF